MVEVFPVVPLAKGHTLVIPKEPAETLDQLSDESAAAIGRVRVRGEISGFKRHVSGHCYFTLKDDSACIDAVIWRGQAAALRQRIADSLTHWFRTPDEDAWQPQILASPRLPASWRWSCTA